MNVLYIISGIMALIGISSYIVAFFLEKKYKNDVINLANGIDKELKK